jgi:hypothetical protein
VSIKEACESLNLIDDRNYGNGAGHVLSVHILSNDQVPISVGYLPNKYRLWSENGRS